MFGAAKEAAHAAAQAVAVAHVAAHELGAAAYAIRAVRAATPEGEREEAGRVECQWHPEHADDIQQVLAIPHKRFQRAEVTHLDQAEIVALLAAPDRSTWHGRRDHALLLLAVQTGFRLSELTGLKIEDVHLGPGAHVRTLGKGRKARRTPLKTQAVAVLRVWLRERGGRATDPLFPTRNGTRLSPDAVERLVAKHAATAAQSRTSLNV